jgi:hypothetical protein
VSERHVDHRAALERSGLRAEALDPVEIGEDRELADEDLGRLADRVLGSIEPFVVTSRMSLS